MKKHKSSSSVATPLTALLGAAAATSSTAITTTAHPYIKEGPTVTMNEHHRQQQHANYDQFVSRVDQILDRERQENKSKKWNKLDNSLRIEKLHEFAHTKVGDIMGLNPVTEAAAAAEAEEAVVDAAVVEKLKAFFCEALQKKKLMKAKEVIYDHLTGVVLDVPSLMYEYERGFFYLKSAAAAAGATTGAGCG